MKSAHDFLLDYFPNADTEEIGSAENDRIHVTAFLVQAVDEVGSYYVVSEKHGSDYVPKAISIYPHIPYDLSLVNTNLRNEKTLGLFVSVVEIYDANAIKVKFRQSETIRIVDVVAHHVVLFDWDLEWPNRPSQPQAFEILLQDEWVPTVAPGIPGTVDAFFAAYSQYYPTLDRRFSWAGRAFSDMETWEERLALVQSIVDRAPDNAHFLDNLAAGPVEDLLNHKLLDHIERDQINKSKWCRMLRGVYTHSEPTDVAKRVEKIIGNFHER